MSSDSRVLIVCEKATAARALVDSLNAMGHSVCGTAASGQEAVAQAAALRPDLVVVDLAAHRAERVGSAVDVPVVYLVDGDDLDDARLERARSARPASYVLRPFDERQLRLNIDAALTMHETHTWQRKQDQQRVSALEKQVTQLHERVALFDAVVNGLTDGVAVIDREGKFVTVNAASERITGHDPRPDPARWRETFELFESDERTPIPPEKSPLRRTLREAARRETEVFLRRRDQSEGIHLAAETYPLRDAQGGMLGAVAVFRDISELRKTEQRLEGASSELERQARFMEEVFDGISDGVVVADKTGKLTLANKSATRMVGMGLTDADSSEWASIYGTFYSDGETPCPSSQLPLVRALGGESTDNVELFIRNPHVPQGVHISVSGRPLRDASGALTGGVIVFRDSTRRIQMQKALLEAFASGRLEIIDTVLHNVGNAINSVATGIDTILGEARDNELLYRFTTLAAAVAAHEDDWTSWLSTDPQGRTVRPFFLALVDDLVRQNEARKQTVERVSERVQYIVDVIRTQESFADSSVERKVVDLRTLVDDAVLVVQESFSKRSIAVEIECSRAPARIRVQESQFHQMLVNLLKNAVEAIDDRIRAGGEFDEQPRIRVLAYVDGDALVLDVIDNGIGIDPENFQQIFWAGYTTKASGSGLGLHSAANYVIGSGGRIMPLSKGIGHGTTIRVMLRLPASHPHPVSSKELE